MFEQADALIVDRLDDNWNETPIDFDNMEFVPIRGIAFIRLQIQWAVTELTSIGGRAKGEGFIDISIFVPSKTGTRRAARMADDLSYIFNRWASGTLEFKAATVQRVGEYNEWFQIKVLVPFKYDECYANNP